MFFFSIKAKELESSSEISIEIIQQILIDIEQFYGTNYLKTSASNYFELFSKLFKGKTLIYYT